MDSQRENNKKNNYLYVMEVNKLTNCFTVCLSRADAEDLMQKAIKRGANEQYLYYWGISVVVYMPNKPIDFNLSKFPIEENCKVTAKQFLDISSD